MSMRRIHAIVLGAALAVTASTCGDDATSPNVNGPGTDFEQDCFIRFGIVSGDPFSALDAEVGLTRAPGRFVGAGHEVECERLDDRLAVYANNCGEEGGCWFGVRPLLVIQAQATHEVATPLDLLDCRFVGSDVPEVADFDIEVVDASNESYVQLDPLPVVAVTQIECRDSTVTTTSTTVPDPCIDVTCANGEACSAGLCRAVTGYEIDIGLETAVELGALQYSVFYDCAEGGFVGERDDVRCAPNPSLNAYSSFNDRLCDPATAAGHFSAATTSIVGFAGPVLLATCEFESKTGAAPIPAQFALEVVDASDTDLHPVAGTRVFIQGIRPVAR